MNNANQHHSIKDEYDVIVAGGGPGGSTVAALLAMEGRDVLLVERDKFPRYHIGESLVPGVMPVLEELGVLDEVQRHGFVDKYGITLVWGARRDAWSVQFGESGEAGDYDRAFQVVRSEFDYLLLQNARRRGVTVLEETRVRDFLFDGARCTGISIKTHYGVDRSVHARYVVDATGQANLMGRRVHRMEMVEDLKNLAVWTYFQGGTNQPGRQAGNIIVENNITDGWLWLIPLHDGTHSIGLVAPQDRLKNRSESLGQVLMDKIAESEEVGRYLEHAVRVSGFYTHKDWSYACTHFKGPGYLIVGDAAGFVDPLFSTGVFLAMNSASLAAKTISAGFQYPERESEYAEAYESAYRGFLDVVTSFVQFFYDASRNQEAYFDRAKDLVDPFDVMTARQDFVYLISGLGGVHPLVGMSPDQALEALNKQVRKAS